MRSYNQYCGVAKALDLVGQRWALLIVRDLLPGPRRFTDLLRAGLTPNVLSSRLAHLREVGLVEHITLPPPASRRVWALTEAGRELQPVVLALGAFGAAYLGSPEGQLRDARWMMVSLQRRWRPVPPFGVVQLTVEGVPYKLRLQPEGLVVVDGVAGKPGASVSGDFASVSEWLLQGSVAGLASQEGDALLLDSLVRGLGLGGRPTVRG